jgi:hypothetical protein
MLLNGAPDVSEKTEALKKQRNLIIHLIIATHLIE